jgi:hypothetical protein
MDSGERADKPQWIFIENDNNLFFSSAGDGTPRALHLLGNLSTTELLVNPD